MCKITIFSPNTQRASTVQFNFLSFDELVPFLPKFRDNFPNVEHYEFSETNLHSMNQLNALAQVMVLVAPYLVSRCRASPPSPSVRTATPSTPRTGGHTPSSGWSTGDYSM